MKKGWSKVALGELMRKTEDAIVVRSDVSYPNLGIYGQGRGTFTKPPISGAATRAESLYRVRAGQFIYSRLFAFEGAYALVEDSQNGFFVSNEFPSFELDQSRLLPRFLRAYFCVPTVWTTLASQSTGLGNRRQRVHPEVILAHRVPLPPLPEQERLVSHLDAIEARLTRAQKLREEQDAELQAALRSAFHKLEAKADWVEMGKVAPLVRREVEIHPEGSYPELGIRSFGRGTFHKPPVLGIETTKRLFEIHAGDLVFSNVFAWEGAIAVAQPEDHGRLGSHRFISCVCDNVRVLAEYLQFYFLTPDGLEKIGKASPGGAGRNRTLGIEKLAEIKVPIVPLVEQTEFKKLLDLQAKVRAERAIATQRVDALLPSLLDRIFNQ